MKSMENNHFKKNGLQTRARFGWSLWMVLAHPKNEWIHQKDRWLPRNGAQRKGGSAVDAGRDQPSIAQRRGVLAQ